MGTHVPLAGDDFPFRIPSDRAMTGSIEQHTKHPDFQIAGQMFVLQGNGRRDRHPRIIGEIDHDRCPLSIKGEINFPITRQALSTASQSEKTGNVQGMHLISEYP